MNNSILAAFEATAILEDFDCVTHRIVVELDGRFIGEVEPQREGFHDRAYAYEYRGVTRGRDGVTPIGPAHDPNGMKRRLISVMFNGDVDAFNRARLIVMRRSELVRDHNGAAR